MFTFYFKHNEEIQGGGGGKRSLWSHTMFKKYYCNVFSEINDVKRRIIIIIMIGGTQKAREREREKVSITNHKIMCVLLIYFNSITIFDVTSKPPTT